MGDAHQLVHRGPARLSVVIKLLDVCQCEMPSRVGHPTPMVVDRLPPAWEVSRLTAQGTKLLDTPPDLQDPLRRIRVHGGTQGNGRDCSSHLSLLLWVLLYTSDPALVLVYYFAFFTRLYN